MDEKIKVAGHSALNLFGLSLAGVLGFITANYLNLSASYGAWAELGAGAVIFLVPAFLIKEHGLAWGMLRIYLGITGLTMVLRSLIGYGSNSGLIPNMPTIPAGVSAAV